MTFFFGGEALCELPPNELLDWHTKVQNRLNEANFVLLEGQNNKNNNKMDDGEKAQDDYYFDVTDMRLFSPGRNNLVRAIPYILIDLFY